MGKEKEMSKDKKKRKLQKYKQKNPTIIIDGEEFARQVNPFTGSISADSMAKDKKGKFIKMYQNPQNPGDRANRLKRIRKLGVELNKIEQEREDRKDSKAGGGKVKSKFFTGGTVNPLFGGEFDDR